jgi:aspartate carbamoyltransferase catalytic subunit
MWDRRHLLGLKDMGREDIELILDNARSFKEVSDRDVKKVPALRGRTVVNLFFENSTRTRMSFELAAKRLSADVINFAASTSSLNKGETMLDTLKTIESYSTDIFIVRHSHSTAALYLSRNTSSSVVNAGDGQNEHPTQALLDMFTVREKLGTLEGLKVAILGDIAHSRVARSNIWGFSKFGARVYACGPATLIPPCFDQMPCTVTYSLEEALTDADVVIMLRIQRERQREMFFPSTQEYIKYFSLNRESIRLLKPGALVMHPGPVNWDVEIDSAVKDRVFPLILEQVNNGLAVRMAVLYLLRPAEDTAVVES